MISCDTNLFLYYLNSDCPEHEVVRPVIEKFMARPDFVVCELVLVELYVLLRNPLVVKRRLTASEAVEVVQSFRSNPNWSLVDYTSGLMDSVWSKCAHDSFPRRAIFDARLAKTLLHHGVEVFYTRNKKHFLDYGFKEVVDPVSEG